MTGISLNSLYFYFSKETPSLIHKLPQHSTVPIVPGVTVLVSKQESEVGREFSCCSTIAYVFARRELTVPIVVMHFVSTFTECIRYTDQVSRFIPLPSRHIFEVKTSVYRSLFNNSAWCSWTQCIFLPGKFYNHNYFFLTRSSKRPKEYLSS